RAVTRRPSPRYRNAAPNVPHGLSRVDRLSAKMADVAGSGQSRSVGRPVILALVAAAVVAIVLLWRTPASPGAPIASGSAAVSNSPVATPSSTGSAGQSTRSEERRVGKEGQA